MRNRKPYKILTPTRSGNSTRGVVGVGACPNDRSIAYAPVFFVGHASGRGAGRDISIVVKGHSPNGSEFPIFCVWIKQNGFFARFFLLYFLPLLVTQRVEKI